MTLSYYSPYVSGHWGNDSSFLSHNDFLVIISARAALAALYATRRVSPNAADHLHHLIANNLLNQSVPS